MRYINFEISGERVESKLLTYCSSRYPDFSVYGNDTFSGFRFRDHGGEKHVLILFNYKEDVNKAIINLGLAEFHFNFPLDKLLDKIFVNEEFKKFQEWAIKWGLTIKNEQIGVCPSHSPS